MFPGLDLGVGLGYAAAQPPQGEVNLLGIIVDGRPVAGLTE
jgi:hypothetical protein